MATLSDHCATFRFGHTDTDASSVLSEVLEITGRHFAILWDFKDCWGLGGNSDMVEIDSLGRQRDCPSEWTTFLYEVGNTVAAEDLTAARPGNCLKHRARIKWDNDFNLFRRQIDGEAGH